MKKKKMTIPNLFLRAGAEPAVYRELHKEIHEINIRNMTLLSWLVIALLAILIVASFFADGLEVNRKIYLIGLLLMVVILILTKTLCKKSEAFTFWVMYIFIAIILLVGIGIGTLLSPNEITATYIALLLITPQFFTDRPFWMYLVILISDLIFIVLVLKFKDPLTWSSDITNALVFGFLSCMLYTLTIVTKISRFSLEITIRFMAENDQLTGLKNRNSYERSIAEGDILAAKSIYCVYVDVNGLHELNNTEGHEAGDRMLQYIATVMQNIFGKEDTYRIGGDEYVALGRDYEVPELQAKCAELKNAVETAGYHIAIGISQREKTEINLGNLIKQAETQMYDDKRRYYEQKGIDRRRRSSYATNQ